MAKIKFTVKSDAKRYKLWLDKTLLDLSKPEDETEETVDDGLYTLEWAMVGNHGSQLTVVGTIGDKKVVEITERKIPWGRTSDRGLQPFEVDEVK